METNLFLGEAYRAEDASSPRQGSVEVVPHNIQPSRNHHRNRWWFSYCEEFVFKDRENFVCKLVNIEGIEHRSYSHFLQKSETYEERKKGGEERGEVFCCGYFQRSNTAKKSKNTPCLQEVRLRRDFVCRRMGDHLVLYVDRLITPAALQSMQGADGPGSSAESSCTQTALAPGSASEVKRVVEHEVSDEEEPLIQMVECRICQEEDHIKNLETPCACSGSLKFAHRKCVQRWCNEKGDITCEICHQPYQSGYTAPPPPPQSEDTTIDIRQVGAWTISGAPLDLHDPRLLAMAAAERHFLEAEYDEYAATNASGAAFCRSAALILMALLLLRHALTITNPDGADDASTFFSLFLLRAAGFLLPCYIMAWAISILQRRRQRQEAAAMAATEVAFVLQSGQHRVVQPGKVLGIGSIDHVLRWDKQEEGLVGKNSHVLKAVMEELKTQKNLAPGAPETPKFDPNRSSKRRVRRGSDPIHNRG
ncbi:hypothetical protein NE237_019551 [Protea cynaroides]|uniref:RING-CH-type domain-containing protein n=1 Tax=Protea cynaroides TaxID=273540 RepID=A0A9Q0K1H1_9MAGN|nr:hypothetical protein NE237_019551 [Protea cynaroides]